MHNLVTNLIYNEDVEIIKPSTIGGKLCHSKLKMPKQVAIAFSF